MEILHLDTDMDRGAKLSLLFQAQELHQPFAPGMENSPFYLFETACHE